MDTLTQQIIFLIIKINNFWGDLSSISAETATLICRLVSVLTFPTKQMEHVLDTLLTSVQLILGRLPTKEHFNVNIQGVKRCTAAPQFKMQAVWVHDASYFASCCCAIGLKPSKKHALLRIGSDHMTFMKQMCSDSFIWQLMRPAISFHVSGITLTFLMNLSGPLSQRRMPVTASNERACLGKGSVRHVAPPVAITLEQCKRLSTREADPQPLHDFYKLISVHISRTIIHCFEQFLQQLPFILQTLPFSRQWINLYHE